MQTLKILFTKRILAS